MVSEKELKVSEKKSYKHRALSRAITFYGILLLYTFVLNGQVDIKDAGLVLIFTIGYWILSRFQTSQ